MRMRPVLFIIQCYLLIAIGLVACKGQQEQRPENVLPVEKMIAMQADIHQIEAEFSIRRMDFPVAKKLFDRQLDSVARKNGTDTATFHRSFVWYAEHIDQMDKVYQAVIDSLALRESRWTRRPAAQDTAARKGL